MWIEYANSHVYNGIATDDSDVGSCKSSCSRNSSCSRLDWSASASPGQRCWLHGPWSSSEQRRSSPGLSHYELRRSAVAHWVKYGDTHVRGGIPTNATDLAGCRRFCLIADNCTRIDWVPAAAVERRCWIHGSWNRHESQRSAPNVMHFEFYRGSDGLCGEQRVHSLIHSERQQPLFNINTFSYKESSNSQNLISLDEEY